MSLKLTMNKATRTGAMGGAPGVGGGGSGRASASGSASGSDGALFRQGHLMQVISSRDPVMLQVRDVLSNAVDNRANNGDGGAGDDGRVDGAALPSPSPSPSPSPRRPAKKHAAVEQATYADLVAAVAQAKALASGGPVGSSAGGTASGVGASDMGASGVVADVEADRARIVSLARVADRLQGILMGEEGGVGAEGLAGTGTGMGAGVGVGAECAQVIPRVTPRVTSREIESIRAEGHRQKKAVEQRVIEVQRAIKVVSRWPHHRPPTAHNHPPINTRHPPRTAHLPTTQEQELACRDIDATERSMFELFWSEVGARLAHPQPFTFTLQYQPQPQSQPRPGRCRPGQGAQARRPRR